MGREMHHPIPNFFIIGGPRSGTSALTRYLAEHRNVFLPEPQEPHYFCSDLRLGYRVTELDDYLGLFKGARECHRAIGETAGWYLHSEVAVSAILEFNPAARFVVVVRNPIDLVQSLHAYHLARSLEDEPHLEVAWSLQEARQCGGSLPRLVSEPRQLQYRWVGSLGAHLERAMSIIPGPQLKVLVHDDLEAAPARVYQELLDFLSLPAVARTRFPRVNVSERRRSGVLQRLLYQPPAALRLGVRAMARIVGPKRIYALEDRVRRLNRSAGPPAPLSATFREVLAEEFDGDVALLSRLVGRDLSGWLRLS